MNHLFAIAMGYKLFLVSREYDGTYVNYLNLDAYKDEDIDELLGEVGIVKRTMDIGEMVFVLALNRDQALEQANKLFED